MSETRVKIMDIGEMLIRTKGYHAFSYKDISTMLEVKNAAIHYHFPSKTDLGVAIIERAINSLEQCSERWGQLQIREKLTSFVKEVYVASNQKGWVCLMGALGPAHDSLPPEMQEKLKMMGEKILEWLTNLLKEGLATGELAFSEPPNIKAQMVIASLLSSLLLDKVLGDAIFMTLQNAVLQSVIKPD